MQENEEKNIKIVAGSKKSRTFATAIEKQRLQKEKRPWMSGLVSGRKTVYGGSNPPEPPKARKD